MALKVLFCLLCIIVNTCASCLSGTYASGVANPPCYTCPRNTSSPAGGTTTTACGCSAGATGISGSCTAHPQCVLATSLTCSGTCPCTPTTTAQSGVISDGPGDYNNNLNCIYLFSSNAIITLRFTLFSLQIHDWVTIDICTTATCATNIRLLRHSGILAGWPYASTASHPFMRVWFTTNSAGKAGGFDANWAVTGTPQCPCRPGQYSVNSNSCADCPPNSFSSAASTTCECNAGFDGPNGPNSPNVGPCVPSCGPGTYSSRLIFEVEVVKADCQPSTVGVYHDGGQLDFYIKPSDASYATMYIRRGNNNNFIASTALTGTAARIFSPPATSIAAVTTMQEWCVNTSSWTAGKVVIVARLTSPVCSPCMAGTHKSMHGNQACANCPANSDSPVASTAQSSCYCNTRYTGENGGTCTACGDGTGVPCVCPDSYEAKTLTDAFAAERKSAGCVDFVAL